MTSGLIAVVAVLAVAVVAGVAWQRSNGRIREVRAGNRASSTAAAPSLTGAQLGRPLGDRATLVQFSSAFCAPCRATRRVVAEVAGLAEGVVHAEVDAPSRLDLVRAFRIYVTPTVLVLAPDGRVVNRVSGQPRKTDLIAALGHVVTAANSK